ncbi:tetratricopeptide repeat protein [Roseibium sp.]|uniref:tetratricopeptide repeat protein n=1 Tax=Roseibium sp. TaxID=1936156 RepID=UPI00326490BE
MSILDLGFQSGDDFINSLNLAAPMIEDILKDSGLSENNRVKLMQAGYSPKEILDLSDREMDALFQSGYQAMGVGDLQAAEDVFTTLCRLDSLDARFPFALAATLQLQGRYATAAKLYVVALGLNATHVDAYVRLGECLIEAREFDQAQEVLEIALALTEKGHGDEEARSQAESLIAQISELAARA